MTRPANALVSVVIPVRNAERYIADAVMSVLTQSHRALEVLVVDDGSTDGSVEVVKQVADRRLRLLRQAPSGAAAARNLGIAESTAPLLPRPPCLPCLPCPPCLPRLPCPACLPCQACLPFSQLSSRNLRSTARFMRSSGSICGAFGWSQTPFVFSVSMAMPRWASLGSCSRRRNASSPTCPFPMCS